MAGPCAAGAAPRPQRRLIYASRRPTGQRFHFAKRPQPLEMWWGGLGLFYSQGLERPAFQEDCKSAYPGSIPGVASSFLENLLPLCYPIVAGSHKTCAGRFTPRW